MRHRKHTFKIGRSGAHRKALMANQISSLIENGQIKTTVTKAKEASRIADKMVTLGKKGTLHHRRLAISKLRNKDAVARLFSEVAPVFASRDGGYTRIIRTGQRRGDAAEMCILQFVEPELIMSNREPQEIVEVEKETAE
jgi:large subunit ribosomal protein L17